MYLRGHDRDACTSTLAATIGSLGLMLGSPLAVAEAASGNWAVVGHLYVNDNAPGVNTVAGFDRLDQPPRVLPADWTDVAPRAEHAAGRGDALYIAIQSPPARG